MNPGKNYTELKVCAHMDVAPVTDIVYILYQKINLLLLNLKHASQRRADMLVRTNSSLRTN